MGPTGQSSFVPTLVNLIHTASPAQDALYDRHGFPKKWKTMSRPSRYVWWNHGDFTDDPGPVIKQDIESLKSSLYEPGSASPRAFIELDPEDEQNPLSVRRPGLFKALLLSKLLAGGFAGALTGGLAGRELSKQLGGSSVASAFSSLGLAMGGGAAGSIGTGVVSGILDARARRKAQLRVLQEILDLAPKKARASKE